MWQTVHHCVKGAIMGSMAIIERLGNPKTLVLEVLLIKHWQKHSQLFSGEIFCYTAGFAADINLPYMLHFTKFMVS